MPPNNESAPASDGQDSPSPNLKPRPLWKQLGPGLITAAVVIGPGTITVASKIGAADGTNLVWAVVIAGSFMMLFTSVSARIGIVNEDSILRLVARHYGKWLSLLIGILAFAVCAGYQSSNYLACSNALETMTGISEGIWMGIVGIAGLLFVFGPRQLYKTLEKVMTTLVAVMLLAFLVNLVVSRPSIVELFSGLIPGSWPGEMNGLLIAMFATTFSVIAALYQSTLAQQKKWTESDLKVGIKESYVGISALLAVSLMILWTSASFLRGKEIESAADLANQLHPLLGNTSVYLFGIGFLAAGFSSTVVNAMIGGGLLADGIGLNANLNGMPARLLTAAAMAVGLTAGYYLQAKETSMAGIVIAQQSTILTVPLIAAVMILMANDRRFCGKFRNSIFQNAWSGFALVVLLAMSVYRLLQMFGNGS